MSAPADPIVRIDVLHCPRHGVYAVSVDDTRVTPRKCCGSWRTVASWNEHASRVQDALPKAGER